MCNYYLIKALTYIKIEYGMGKKDYGLESRNSVPKSSWLI